MPPKGTHASSRERAAAAYQLRCMGRTWTEIATAQGFGSHGAAHSAVLRHIKRMPAEDRAIARAFSAGNYQMVIAQLHEIAATAKRAGHTRTAVEALTAIAATQDRHDKLTGVHIAVPTEINIHVTAAQVISDARERLLSIVDAEVVEDDPKALPA